MVNFHGKIPTTSQLLNLCKTVLLMNQIRFTSDYYKPWLGTCFAVIDQLQSNSFHYSPFIRVKRLPKGWPFCNLCDGNEDETTTVFSCTVRVWILSIPFDNSVGQTTNLMYQYWSKLNNFCTNMGWKGWRRTKENSSILHTETTEALTKILIARNSIQFT